MRPTGSIPMNFTAKRQAWSLAAPEAGAFARFWQGPLPGHEDEWPYESDWLGEVRTLRSRAVLPAARGVTPDQTLRPLHCTRRSACALAR